MEANGHTPWHITGRHAGSCNCDWACPCQFNALPNHGYCEALLAWEITDGNFGDLSMDGVRFGFAVHWPGAIDEYSPPLPKALSRKPLSSASQPPTLMPLNGSQTPGRSR